MQIDIKAKDIELTQDLELLIFNKLGADVDKYLKNFNEDIKKAEVTIEHGSRWGFKVSFSMMLPGKEHIYAVTEDKNLTTAINSLKDVVQKEVVKYKSKLQDYRG